MYIGIIADDFTGGTDIAGFLVENGVSTIQLGGRPQDGFTTSADAAVVSLKTRSCPSAEAVEQSLAALEWLQTQGCRNFFFKYCSTFDSTEKGNIGPVTDALLDRLGARFTILCPALPINGRTVYCGHLFVNGVPLAESGMRNHPVNPMKDSSLVRLMEMQATGRAENIPLDIIEQGPDAIRKAFSLLQDKGIRYAVPDTLTEAHLVNIGRAVADMPLVTGGSGLAIGIARVLSERPGWNRKDATSAGAPHPEGRPVILSGSCSVMTNAQVSRYLEKAPSFFVDVGHCMADPEAHAKKILQNIQKEQNTTLAPLIYATVASEKLQEIQQKYGAAAASHAVEAFFHYLTRFLQKNGYDHFIVAGGETAGAVVQSLDVEAFHIGPQIAPGVPWVRAVNLPLSFALKSGNFGDENFFFTAQDMIKRKS